MQATRATDLERGVSREAACAIFDELAPVSIEQLIGSWKGSGVPTGHPLDGMLESYGWHGKRFDTAEIVHPLVFKDGKWGLVPINPSYLPLKPVLRHAGFLRRPSVAGIARRLLPIARTSDPQARLRMTEFRGVVTATMIYDSLPIHDVFRGIDDDTLLGLMDLRYTREPFFFLLRREG